MKDKPNRALIFLRRNAVYLILALCIVAVGLSIILMATDDNGVNSGNVDDIPTVTDPVDPDPNEPNDPNPPENPDEKPTITDPVDLPVEFISPVQNPTSISEYSEQMVFNSTLNRYSAHKAIDFYAPEGTEVLAVYDGTILSIENTLLEGTTIVIDHGDGLKTVYNSLLDGENVSVGQKVVKGQVIGEVSSTNRQEYKAGAHLHFEVMENDKVIDPAKYLSLDLK